MPSSIRRGNVVSNDSKSFENRDNIRPKGVVSKKLIGRRITLNNNFRWSIRAALKAPSHGTKDTP